MKIGDFSEEMRNEIVRAAKRSLMKVGVTAEVYLDFLSGLREDVFSVQLQTAMFNTTPSIFKYVYIECKTQLVEVEGQKNVYNLDFNLKYWFEGFDGCRGYTKLGDLKFNVIDEENKRVKFVGFIIS